MWEHLLLYLFIVHSFHFAECGYPPMGDEVQAGSVLLPASRRGRYLANIVRRQAVDGTGIKFNKDADRMNAEAKKKVDVLSEELLPYIIAEQERRTTLYKRVMTAIQNGEKGITIAEIRNKPPTIIRKGLMYRCPTNRAPKEPDGSGVMMCEDDQRPKDIIFESCLSAEDKELFVADNKYFFCNRHKIEGADLPHNGSRVIGCAPCERTPLNYTSQRCALEDTADVVVHYRYYPDRTYKFVSELDPEREVCDHWNPCQIGYIFSLPGPDQATPANELWPDFSGDTDEEIEREEIVPPVPEDTNNETVIPGEAYSTSMRRVHVPRGFRYHGIGKYQPKGQRRYDTEKLANLHVHAVVSGEWVKISLVFTPLHHTDVGTYYVRFERSGKKGDFLYVPLVTISLGKTHVHSDQVVALPMTSIPPKTIWYTCDQCTLSSIMLRGADGAMRNVEKYHLHKTQDKKGAEKTEVEFDWGMVKFSDLGDYFLIIVNEDGFEERLFGLSFKAPEIDPPPRMHIELKRNSSKISVTSPVDTNVGYTCPDEKLGCSLLNVMCNGESAVEDGMVAHQASSKRFTFSYASFDDKHACVYLAIFKVGENYYRKILAVFENASPNVEVVGGRFLAEAPEEGTPYMHLIHYKCNYNQDCSLASVTVNGFPLELGGSTQESASPVAFYIPGELSITIGIAAYNSLYEGVYMGVFTVDGANVSKVLMEIRSGKDTDSVPEDEGTNSTTEEPDTESEGEPETETSPIIFASDTTPQDSENTPGKDAQDSENTTEKDPQDSENTTEKDPQDSENTTEKDPQDSENTTEKDPQDSENTTKKDPQHSENTTEKDPKNSENTTEKDPQSSENTTEKDRQDSETTTEKDPKGSENTTDKDPQDSESTTEKDPQDSENTPGNEPPPGENPPTDPDTRRIAVAVDTPTALVRGAVTAGDAFRGAVRGQPGALAAVRCRGYDAISAWRAAPDGTLRLDIQHFKDSNACVYIGTFKTGNTEHRKTLAVLENNSPMIQVASSKVAAPPAGGALKHSVVYTCNLTKCDPQMIYINDRTLKSDKRHFYSFKSKKGKGKQGVTTVTVDLSIAPFTPDFEGVYQVVVGDDKQTITKNLMEVGKLI